MSDLLKQTKELCQQYGIKPARSRGQNFLVSQEVYDDIIQASDLDKNDVVLEVGPGLGFLTQRLAQVAGKVVAVEIDKNLAEILRSGAIYRAVKNHSGAINHPGAINRARTEGNAKVINDSDAINRARTEEIKDNIEIINDDILKYQFPIPESRFPYKIVANLPYNITSIFLRKFLTTENKPEMMVLMLQKEVAERIVAKPGKMSLLAVSVQYFASPKIIRYVSKDDFWPSPEVDSAVVRIDIKTGHSTRPPSARLGVASKPVDNEEKFFQMVKFGFSAKRKMLKNNLSAGYKKDQKELEKLIVSAGFNPKVRAQELSVEDWKKLFAVVSGNVL